MNNKKLCEMITRLVGGVFCQTQRNCPKTSGSAFPPTYRRTLTIMFTVASGRKNEAGVRRHQLLDCACESEGPASCEGRERDAAAVFGEDFDQRNGTDGSAQQF